MYVCDRCHLINRCHYDNPFNSSKFCNYCGSYCSKITDTEENREFHNEKQERYLFSEKEAYQNTKQCMSECLAERPYYGGCNKWYIFCPKKKETIETRKCKFCKIIRLEKVNG